MEYLEKIFGKNNFKRVSLRSRNGQSLVEAVVAVSVLITGFMGILGLLSRSFYINRVVADDYTASYLASEGIEVVKNLIDHNVIVGSPWNSGFTDGSYEVEYSTASFPLQSFLGRNLLFSSSTDLYGYSGTVPTNFVRKVQIALIGQDEMIVNSTVSWNTGSLQSSVNLEDRFFNWR